MADVVSSREMAIYTVAVATFTPRRNNTTLAIFTPVVTYSMHVYILKTCSQN